MMASNDIDTMALDMTDLVKVPQELRGLVIGKQGRRLREIKEESGVSEIEMRDEGVHLRGTRGQIARAKDIIVSTIRAKQNETSSSCQKKDVSFDAKLYGFVIGHGGATVREIQKKTGTKIQIDKSRDTAVAHITGPTEEHLSNAEKNILDLVSQKQEEAHFFLKKDVHFPSGSAGVLIGPKGATIRRIQNDTQTTIEIDGTKCVAHIAGPSQERVTDAEQKINDLVSKQDAERNAKRRQNRHKRQQFAVVDGTYVGEDNFFKLQNITSVYPEKLNYKLVMEGNRATQEKEMAYVSQLEEMLLKVLRGIREEIDDSRNIRTDMWCHFGHVLIHGVDEAEAGETYELEEINKNLQGTHKNSPWKAHFKAGVVKLEHEALEDVLKERPLKVKPNTRFDLTFLSPTKHQIRFKAFVPDSSNEDGCFLFQDDLVPVKNTLADQSSLYKYRLCAPSSTRLKVDILIPYLTFDCHLVLRTTMREVKDLTLPEEDKLLRDFLDDNLKYENGKVILPMDKLPEGFSHVYKRQAKRRSYPYSLDDTISGFNVMISEEEFQEESHHHEGRSLQEEVQTKTDIHVHCDAWDELLDQEDWEPQAIVSQLPGFLRFVKEIQANIEVNSEEVDE